MTQGERWMQNYNEVMTFIESNHRNPSKHRIEEQVAGGQVIGISKLIPQKFQGQGGQILF